MDYTSEEYQGNRKKHKKRFKVVLQELVHPWRKTNSKKNVNETINVKHQYVEFLQFIDFQGDLKMYYPDLVTSIGEKFGQIELEGPACQVVDATVIIKEQIHKICEKHLTLPQSNLIWNIVAKNRWNEYFAKQLGKAKRKAKVCVGPSNALVILAFSQEDCERAFEVLFEIIREDTLVITKDFPIQSDHFQTLIAKLQRGTLVQIEVFPDAEENVVRIIGANEDITQATQEISDFIQEKGLHNDAYRPQVSQNIWNFFARRANHESVKQIAKDLEQYNVSIQIADDHEYFLVHGLNKGIEQSKKRLGELSSMIVEKEKKLEYPGIERLFVGKVGMEQLSMIEKEMDVEIEIVCSGKKMPLSRGFSLPNKAPAKTDLYDLCNFTTKEGLRLSWKYGNIENEAADVLVNCAQSNLNHLTACGRALMGRGGMGFQEACKNYTAVQPGDIVVTESGNLLSKHVVHAVCRKLSEFKEASDAFEFLQGLIQKILKKSCQLEASSIAMPLVGAAEHGFPEEVVLQTIRNEVNQFSCSKGGMLLPKYICIIVFQPESGKREAGSSVTRPMTSTSSLSDQQERINGTNSTNPITLGSIRFHLCSGNQKQHQATALIHLPSEKVKLLTNIPQNGERIEPNNSASKKGIEPPPGTVLVENASDDENIKYHMHSFPVSYDANGLERAVKACLDAAIVFNCNNVVIPAADIHRTFNISTSECANVIMNESHFLPNTNSVMDIRLVELNNDEMQIFQKAFEISAGKQTTNALFYESANESLIFGTKEEITLRVVGFRNSVIMAMKKIEAYFNRCKVSNTIINSKLVHRLWEHNYEIERLVNRYEVCVTLSTKHACIEGNAEQVFECKDILVDFLDELDEKEEKLKRLREISEGVQWLYSDANSNFVLFDEILNGMVENESSVGNKIFTIPGKENAYEVDLGKMTIKEPDTGGFASLLRKRSQNVLDDFN